MLIQFKEGRRKGESKGGREKGIEGGERERELILSIDTKF